MNGQRAGAVNVVLIALVGLLIGFIGGYVIGRNAAPVASSATVATGTCPHQLDPKDQWILVGFRCPGTDTAQVALLGCHCNTAHGIEDFVKAELAAGKPGQAIREELIAQYGDRLKFRGQ
ncbi:MAG: hypothetical protein AB1792_10965 [Candidatus Zixiibacteriota bacterium]